MSGTGLTTRAWKKMGVEGSMTISGVWANQVRSPWGDEDGRTLYLCAHTGLYRNRLGIPGIRP